MHTQFALARLLGMRNDAYATSAIIVLTVTCYFAIIMPLPLALPAAFIAIQVPIYLSGGVIIRLTTGTEDNRHVNGIVFMALMVIASAIVAAGTRWQHYVGDAFLALAIANLVAAGIERCDA